MAPSDSDQDPVPATDLHVEATYRLTEALVASENRMRRRVDLLSEVVFETDRDGALVFLNKAWTTATGRTLEACLGQPLQSFVHPDDLARCEHALRADDGHGTARQLIRLQCVDPGLLWVELSAARLPDGGVVGALHDVTEVYQARQDLEAAKVRAEQASEAKTQFLATVSHEMRTPLNAILGSAELMLDGDVSSGEARAHLERVNANAEALLRLISDMLDVSKIEAGQVDIERAPVDLQTCLEDALLPIARQASAKGVSLQLTFDETLPRLVMTDADRLRQVVTNLAVNAVKFTDEGKIRVDATRKAPVDGEAFVLEIQVVDTGAGIAADVQHRIFARFEQGDSSTTRRKGGAGLGLSIVKSLVEAMGGSVSLESEVGRGSRFTVSLPMSQAPASQEAAHPTPQSPPQPDADAGHLGRILIAEDTEANFAVLQIFLTKAGYRVVRAHTGRDAVDMATESDLILMDIEMPEMDGLAATRAIRDAERAEGRVAVPILALTAHAVQGYRDRCLAAGCTGYLAKPVRRRPLLEAVGRALDGRTRPE